MTQNNLGTALQALGAREGNAAALSEAVTAYRSALLERTRDRVPLDWAATQFNLALTMLELFEITGETAPLAEAELHAAGAVDVFRERGAAGYLPLAEARLAAIRAARGGDRALE